MPEAEHIDFPEVFQKSKGQNLGFPYVFQGSGAEHLGFPQVVQDVDANWDTLWRDEDKCCMYTTKSAQKCPQSEQS